MHQLHRLDDAEAVCPGTMKALRFVIYENVVKRKKRKSIEKSITNQICIKQNMQSEWKKRRNIHGQSVSFFLNDSAACLTHCSRSREQKRSV